MTGFGLRVYKFNHEDAVVLLCVSSLDSLSFSLLSLFSTDLPSVSRHLEAIAYLKQKLTEMEAKDLTGNAALMAKLRVSLSQMIHVAL